MGSLENIRCLHDTNFNRIKNPNVHEHDQQILNFANKA